MSRGSPTWRSIRFRAGVSLSLALVAAAVMACGAFAPLYQRAVQQSLVQVKLGELSQAQRGLTLTSTPTGGIPPLDIDELLGVVPRATRTFYGRATGAERANISSVRTSGDVRPNAGRLAWRESSCAHVTTVAGRCPRAADEVMVSTADTRALRLRTGAVVSVRTDKTIALDSQVVDLTVVGVYRQRPDRSWFDERLTGRAGQADPDSPSGSGITLHDTWLTPRATLHVSGRPQFPGVSSEVRLPLRTRAVDADSLPVLDDGLHAVAVNAARVIRTRLSLDTDLDAVAADVAHQSRQPRQIVPLLLAQLALLTGVVLWLVLGATAEQRRPEIAIAYLRGRSRGRVRRELGAEFAAVVVAGGVAGVAVALGLSWLTRHLFLPGSAPFEITRAFALTVVVVLLLLDALIGTIIWRATGADLAQLLRRVRARRSGWWLGIGETLVLAIAGTAVFSFVGGGLSGPLALLAPALLALLVGMVLARLVGAGAAQLGRRQLRRGRPVAAVTALDVARADTTRRLIAIITVAVALTVFCADAGAVARRNRDLAAGQEAGAALVAEVSGDDVATVRDVVHELDPGGRRMTPVVSTQPRGVGSAPTVAVVPDRFATIADYGPVRPRLPRTLRPPLTEALRAQGTTLEGTLRTTSLAANLSQVDDESDPGEDSAPTTPSAPIDLVLRLVDSTTSQAYEIEVGRLRDDDQEPVPISVSLPCARGCTITGLELRTLPGTQVTGSIELDGLSDGHGLSFTPASQWAPIRASGENSTRMTPSSPHAGTFALTFGTDGSDTTVLRHRWLPASLATVVSGNGLRLPPARSRPSLSGVDGSTRAASVVGRVRRVPGFPARTSLVSLDAALRATQPSAQTRVTVWFARPDSVLLGDLRTRLSARGVSIASVSSLAATRTTFEQSAAAWSIDLAVVIGAASLLLGLLVILVLTSATRRQRSRDLASLRMAGWSARSLRVVAVSSVSVAIILSAVAGTVCGVVGSQLALPDLPLFAHQPAVSTLDLSAAWTPVLVAGAVSLVLLLAVGYVTGARTAREAGLNRVRETV